MGTLAGWTALRAPGEQAESLLYAQRPQDAAKLSKWLWTPDRWGQRKHLTHCPQLPLAGTRAALPVGHPPGCPALRSRGHCRCFPEVTSPGRSCRGPISGVSRLPRPVPALVRVQVVTEAAQSPTWPVTLHRADVLNRGPVKCLKPVQWGKADGCLQAVGRAWWMLQLQLGCVQVTAMGRTEKPCSRCKLLSHLPAADGRYYTRRSIAGFFPKCWWNRDEIYP